MRGESAVLQPPVEPIEAVAVVEYLCNDFQCTVAACHLAYIPLSLYVPQGLNFETSLVAGARLTFDRFSLR